MLTVTFNLRDGTFSDIPDDAHELIIEGYGKLTSSQQVLLKRYIIKHQLDISLQHGVPSSPLHSLNIIKTLRTFVKESKVYHPRFHNIIYGWCFIILMFALMIAQESRSYHTFAAPPVRIIKPAGVINSHRPQYNLDSLEEDLAGLEVDDLFESTTKKSLFKTYNQNSRNKESIIRDAVLRALERKDHVGKFAQILPICLLERLSD